MQLPIYMDNHATTRIDPRVLERMLPFFDRDYGNAASREHSFGWKAEEAVDRARGQIAQFIGAAAREIVLTSGATEANNLALFGVAAAYKDKGRHIITQGTEHPAVLDPCRALADRGFDITYLPVDKTGRVRTNDLAQAIRTDTILVSIMHANNEIGSIQSIATLGEICRESNVLFHCDAAQSAGRLPIDVQALEVHLLSLSGHKMYGPKGAGALYVRRKDPRVTLVPLLYGGGHERGLRSGTINVPGVVGLGEACCIAHKEDASQEQRRLASLRDHLAARLFSELDGLHLNGPALEPEGRNAQRLSGNLNISVGGVEGETLLLRLRDVALSSGAACASATLKPSHVLRAIGVSEELAQATLRFGLGRFNTLEEVDFVADLVIRKVQELRPG